MTAFLPDVHILIAMLDPEHPHANWAREWFKLEGHGHWLTCPTTENGAIRVMSGPAYSLNQAIPHSIMLSLDSLRVLGDHDHVPDDVTLFRPGNGRSNSTADQQANH